MKRHLATFATLSLAAAIAVGFFGSGCKKAQNKDLSGAISQAPSSQMGANSTAPTGPTLNASTAEESQAQARANLNGKRPTESPAAVDFKQGGISVAQPPSQVQPAARGLLQAQGSGAASVTASSVVPVPAKPAEPTCFTDTFSHKPMVGHSDEESCSHHRNVLKLSHQNVNPAHVCVRVNGTPVKFERKGDELFFGSIAGPKAKITVRYCTGKTSCAEISKEDCTIPKDEFMEALGGDSADQAVQWESADAAGDSKLNAEVKKELAEIEETHTQEKSQGAQQANVFKDWIREEDTPACFKKAG